SGTLAEPKDDVIDEPLLVDRVSDGVPNAPVRESRVLEVEREVRERVGDVAETVVRLLEGGIVGLSLVLERGEARGVDPLGLQLEKDRGLARDDPIDHAADVR